MSIVALEKLFEWGGEQLAMYCGPDLGDLITITLNKYVPRPTRYLTTLISD
jgi:Ca2+:H+ antiporter